MDVDTGAIREIPPDDKPTVREIEVDQAPDPKCNDCYGRGYQTQIIPGRKVIVPCHCVAHDGQRLAQIRAEFIKKQT